MPLAGRWQEILSTDAAIYGGSDTGNRGGAQATVMQAHGCAQPIEITVPSLAMVYFRHAGP